MSIYSQLRLLFLRSHLLSRIFFVFPIVVLFTLLMNQATYANTAEKLVDAKWLSANLQRSDIVILDIRNKIDGGSRETYLKAHIPGSLHSDYLTEWRATRDNVVGTIPQISTLESHLSQLGVERDDHVVIVPAGVSATDFGSATRVYFILKYLGHKKISILNGGFSDWVKDVNNPIETGTQSFESLKPTQYRATPVEDLVITTQQLVKLKQEPRKPILIDARPYDFYIGKKKHPKVKKYGRIQGALTLTHASFYDNKNNKIYDASTLKNIYDEKLKNLNTHFSQDDTIVSYCNTGHWASINWFVLNELIGVKNVRLYDESLAAWANDDNLPMQSERTRLDDLKSIFN